jgi:predicted transcriptional regulator
MIEVASVDCKESVALTSMIVIAYVSHNSVNAGDLPGLIRQTHLAISRLGGVETPPVVEEGQRPAVPVKNSVTPDFIVCLEDGKEFKSLKRHLQTAYDLTPEQYRAKWKLPSDYPMVAPNYSATRSSLAKTIGLGRSPGKIAQAKPKDVVIQHSV